MPEAVRWQLILIIMSWFTRTEDYSTKESFYGESEITYGSKNDSGSSSTSTSGPWDDYQREREHISSCWDGYSR